MGAFLPAQQVLWANELLFEILHLFFSGLGFLRIWRSDGSVWSGIEILQLTVKRNIN